MYIYVYIYIYIYVYMYSVQTYIYGIQAFMAEDLFDLLNNDPAYINTQVTVSFFEIYGGRCQVYLYLYISVCLCTFIYVQEPARTA
jgi:hypothetical protein